VWLFLAVPNPMLIMLLKKLSKNYEGKVFGFVCDVRNIDDFEKLGEYAKSISGSIDIWINNAGIIHKKLTSLTETSPSELRDIIETNLIGSFLYGTRTAINFMKDQKNGGNIFLMGGAGTNPRMSTPSVSAYGASKAPSWQFTNTISNELLNYPNLGIHLLTPGMVLTDLVFNLMPRDNIMRLKAMNIRADTPLRIASWMVPRIRGAKKTAWRPWSFIKYNQEEHYLWYQLNSNRRSKRFFDPEDPESLNRFIEKLEQESS